MRSERTKYPVIHKDQPLRSVIIGNKKFVVSNLLKLDGVPADVEMVKDFLSNYGIHSNIEIDADAEDMKSVLKRLSKQDFSENSGLIVTITTHGGEGNVLYGKDGNTVQLKELAEMFNSAECETLKNKPKIFIINACRGRKKDSTVGLGPQEPSSRDCKYNSKIKFVLIMLANSLA